jgi:hypothetical protein
MTDTGHDTPPPTLRVNTDTIPAELTAIDRWVLWRWENRKKWTKPPYRPDGRNAKSTDPSTWSTFATAYDAYQRGGFAGIGFVLVDDDDIVGVDLDHCVTNGDASDETLGIVAKLGSYTEVSPSGAGLRVLARAKLPAGWRKHGDIEVYETGRYITITGRRIGDISDIRDRQEAIEAFHAQHGPPPPRAQGTSNAQSDLSDRDVLDLIERAANGARFAALYRGDNLDYPSASEADAAFIGMLAFYTRDEHQLDRIYHGSRRARQKWGERRGDQTYGQRTILSVLSRVTETYTPPTKPTLVDLTASLRTQPGITARRGPDISDPPAGGLPAKRRVKLTPASAIKIRPVRWTWAGRIPMGAVTMTAGHGGLGKSTFHTWLIAEITRGRLAGALMGTPRHCVIAASEDSWSHTIAPRLVAAGAVMDRVHRAEVVTIDGEYGELTLPVDIPALEAALLEVDAALLSVDPLMSRVDMALNTHGDRETRAALEPLSQMADRTGVAVLGNGHFNKSASTDPMALLMGSKAFGNVCRAVIAFAGDVDDDGRPDGTVVVQQVKNNLGRLDLPSLRYRIASTNIDTDEGPADVGRVVPLGETDRQVSQIFASANRAPADESKLEAAVEWLEHVLRGVDPNKGILKKDVVKFGRDDGHTLRTIERAALEEIKVITVREQGASGKPAWWFHPDYPPTTIRQGALASSGQSADQQKHAEKLDIPPTAESGEQATA